MSPARRRTALILVPAVIGALTLAACASGSTSPGLSSGASSASAAAYASASTQTAPASPAASASAPSAEPSPSGVPAVTSPSRNTKVGVTVTGNLGDKPALTVPSGAAPGDLRSEVLVQGSGPVVAKGQFIVVNYLGETWALKDGKPNIFDNSYDRAQPTTFAIGTGAVIKGWDQTLVGQKAGTRVLLSIPPALAYGTDASAQSGLGGQTLLFVVDVLGSFDVNAAADGTVVPTIPADFPKFTNESGKKPAITSVAGVKAGTTERSTLLLKGAGTAIDPKKTLAVQIIQTDLATGTKTQETWGQGIKLIPAASVLQVSTALKDQKVGSRVAIVSPEDTSQGSVVLVLDILGQY